MSGIEARLPTPPLLSCAPRLRLSAVKLHMMLDHDVPLPCYGVITDGKQHEVTVTYQWKFAPGTILVFDRDYTDYI